MLIALSPAARQAAWDDAEQALEAFDTSEGFVGPCTMIAASGVKA